MAPYTARVGARTISPATKPSVALPVDSLLPAILDALRTGPNLVLEAAPGAGKTTRVPPALLELVDGNVLVLEPRRIAARLAARRVAAERGEAVGGSVGYTVRFEDVTGPATRLRFVTEGVLTRRLLTDPGLRGVNAVVLDEFHERHLESDLALMLLRRLQGRRPELRLVVMSATLDAGPIAAYLGGCPVLRSEGRVFPLEVRYVPYSAVPLQAQTRAAVELWLREGASGDALVFLPGAAEIRRAMGECSDLAERFGLRLLALHGDLSPAEQDLAVAPAADGKRKVVFATNVAESSITIDGVATVIDSGLARVATYSPWTGLPTLGIGRVSKASARQRAGRAGRTGPGLVWRLYPEADFAQRPEHDVPEILRSDLAQLCLTLRALGLTQATGLHWLQPPPTAAVEAAETLLDRLGAAGSMAAKLASLPLPPRLGRLLIEAAARGVAEEGCVAAALLGSGSRSESNDLLRAMEAPLDGKASQQRTQLRRLIRDLPQGTRPEPDKRDEALLYAVLAGFGDRVARRRAGQQVQLVGDVAAEVSGARPESAFLLALDVEDRTEKPLPLVRMTARCEPEWLLDVFPERVSERNELAWNRTGERVEAVSALLYGGLVLEETAGAKPEPEAASELLFRKVLESGWERFVDGDKLALLQNRAAFAGLKAPDVERTLRTLCAGRLSFAELTRAAESDLLPILESGMDARKLREFAPVMLTLGKGKQAKVHYEAGKPPWIASRLQDFFGMRDTPRIGPERVPVVVHLLAPNMRAVQTTTDLAGFWERLYPSVRKELSRRYPKHSWPEKP